MKIQERINNLSPFVSGMSFVNGYVIVDTVFSEKWVVKDSDKIKCENTGQNKYRYFGTSEDVDVDDILDFVESIIKLNMEREEKMNLLRAKAEELKVLFAEKSLNQLKRLRFTIDEPDLMDDLNLDGPEMPTEVSQGVKTDNPPDESESENVEVSEETEIEKKEA